MRFNGQTFDDPGLVLLRYTDGTSAVLFNMPHLACRVALLGQPTRVKRIGTARFRAEWDLPGRLEAHHFSNPWTLERREVAGVEVCPAAYGVVTDWLESQYAEAKAAWKAAQRELNRIADAQRVVEVYHVRALQEAKREALRERT